MAGKGFNTDLNPSPDPNYLGASREPSRLDNQNNTFDTLFSGLAKAGDQAIGAVDAGIKKNIKDDVYAAVDPIRNAQGVQTAVDSQPEVIKLPDVNKDAPPNSEEVKGRIAKLAAAKAAGKISDTYYYTQLEATTRQIRARYPGFREEVDQMVQSATGVTPANALRKSLLNDLEQGKSADDRQREADQRWVQQNSRYLEGQAREDWVAGRQVDMTAARAQIQRKTARDQTIQSMDSELSYKVKQGNATAEDAEKVVGAKTEKFWADAWDVQAPLGKMLDGLNRAQKEGRNFDVQELAAIQGKFAEFKAEGMRQFDTDLNRPDENGKSKADIIGSERANKQRELFMKRFDTLEQAIINKDTGALAQNSRMMTADKDSWTRDKLDRFPSIRKGAYLGAIPGMQEYLKVWATNSSSPMMSQQLDAVTKIFREDSARNGTPLTEQIDTLYNEDRGGSKLKARGAAKELIQGMAEDLSNPAVDPEILRNKVKSMFGEEGDGAKKLLNMFKGADHAKLYSQIVKPQVTQNLINKFGVDSPEFKQYSEWAKTGMALTYKRIGDNINEAADRAFLDVRYDEKQNKFVVVPTQEGLDYAKKNNAVGNPLNFFEKKLGDSFASSVDQMNGLVKNIEPILKAAGYDPAKEMGGLLNNMPKNSGIWQNFRRAWSARYEGTVESLEETFGGGKLNFSQAPGGENSRGRISLNDIDPTTGPHKSLLDFVSNAEGTKGNYNIIYGGGSLPKPAEDMSINDVIAFQGEMRNQGSKSTAVGRYQFLRKTLSGLRDELGLKGTEKFTPEVQDKLAVALLKRRGLDAYLKGDLSESKFLDRLSQEWASLPTSSTGQSYYHGDGLNKSLVSKSAAIKAIRAMVDGQT